MPSDPPLSCQVNSLDLFYLVLGYVRYAMGRMSAAPSLAQDILQRYGHALTDHQLTQVADEIEKEIQREERVNSKLGATVDHENWKETLVNVRRQLELRAG